MLNIAKWFKDSFEYPENGEALVNSITDLFTKNAEIVDRAGVSIMFKNGARMMIRMATKKVTGADVTEE